MWTILRGNTDKERRESWRRCVLTSGRMKTLKFLILTPGPRLVSGLIQKTLNLDPGVYSTVQGQGRGMSYCWMMINAYVYTPQSSLSKSIEAAMRMNVKHTACFS